MAKKYRVVISKAAREMLGKHIRFLKRKSKPAAEEMKKEVLAAIASLGTMPDRFPVPDSEDADFDLYRKMFVPKDYMVLFHVTKDTVEVDYIVDCSQDYTWLLD
jgi:plasmid stabilization system protein ParE